MDAPQRLHALDTLRAIAFLLVVAFHASGSFLVGLDRPGMDVSRSVALTTFVFVLHIFHMALFFCIAGFFAHQLFHTRSPAKFWSNRVKRILIPLIVGWLVMFPLLGLIVGWGQSGASGLHVAWGLHTLPGGFRLTHLWFLYYLLLCYAATHAARWIIRSVDRGQRAHAIADSLVSRITTSTWGSVVLAVPAAALQQFRSHFVLWEGIPTPDSLIPEPVSSVTYLTAFVLGWLVRRQTTVLSAWQQSWRTYLTVAVGATTVCVWIVGLHPVYTPSGSRTEVVSFALAYGIATWSWVFGLTGLSLQIFARENRVMRYLADASYWVYIVHMPVVMALRILLLQLPWHWSIKFTLIVGVTMVVTLLTYQFVVRYTFIGATLNGRRHPGEGREVRPRVEGSPDRIAPAV